MNTFTLPLKDVIRRTGGTVVFQGETVDDVLTLNTTMTGGDIGIAFYTIFDPAYKPRLDGLIIDRYYNREIGVETIDLFKMNMRRRLNEIMPFYNLLYESTKIQFDPLSTVDLNTISTGTSAQLTEGQSESNTESNSETESRSVFSNTPQTMLSGSGDYAANATDANGTSDGIAHAIENNTQTADATTNGETSVSGYQGAAAGLIQQYRESLINVDLMLLSELEDLFMGVWDNGDSYNNERYHY